MMRAALLGSPTAVLRLTSYVSPLLRLSSTLPDSPPAQEPEEQTQAERSPAKNVQRMKSFCRRRSLIILPAEDDVPPSNSNIQASYDSLSMSDSGGDESPDLAVSMRRLRSYAAKVVEDSALEMISIADNDSTTPPVHTAAKQCILRLRQSRSARDASTELAEAHSSSTKTNRDAGRPPLHEALDLEQMGEEERRTTRRTAMLFRIRRLRKNHF